MKVLASVVVVLAVLACASTSVAKKAKAAPLAKFEKRSTSGYSWLDGLDLSSSKIPNTDVASRCFSIIDKVRSWGTVSSESCSTLASLCSACSSCSSSDSFEAYVPDAAGGNDDGKSTCLCIDAAGAARFNAAADGDTNLAFGAGDDCVILEPGVHLSSHGIGPVIDLGVGDDCFIGAGRAAFSVYGSDGDDDLIKLHESVHGPAATDVQGGFSGETGNDCLVAVDPIDVTQDGGTGDDVIYEGPGGGATDLYGSGGDDLIIVDSVGVYQSGVASNAASTIEGDSGDDVIRVRGSMRGASIGGGDGEDDIEVGLGSGTQIWSAGIEGNADNDRIEVHSGVIIESDYVDGSTGDDVIIVHSGAVMDSISGGAGDDKIYVSGGARIETAVLDCGDDSDLLVLGDASSNERFQHDDSYLAGCEKIKTGSSHYSEVAGSSS